MERRLAFSWSNLLLACFYCNNNKGNRFDLAPNGQRASFNFADLSQINSCCTNYDATENPRFIHPEREDAEPLLIFQENGFVRSDDARCQYTLDTCKVQRQYLNDDRKKIWDRFLNDLNSEVLEGKTQAEIRSSVMVLVRQFRRDAEQNPDNEFLAFRRFAHKSFLAGTLKEVLG